MENNWKQIAQKIGMGAAVAFNVALFGGIGTGIYLEISGENDTEFTGGCGDNDCETPRLERTVNGSFEGNTPPGPDTNSMSGGCGSECETPLEQILVSAIISNSAENSLGIHAAFEQCVNESLTEINMTRSEVGQADFAAKQIIVANIATTCAPALKA